VLKLKQDNYEILNIIRGRELCHLVEVVSFTTGFSPGRDVGYFSAYSATSDRDESWTRLERDCVRCEILK
jgi:hypothetical protein